MARRRYRASWDELGYLDCDYIRSWGGLAGYSGPLRFETSEPNVVNIAHDPDRDILLATYRWPGQDKRVKIKSEVRIVRRPCPFGGARAFFLCPRCGRSTLRLAVLPEGVRCGCCGRVTWRSRRESETQRLIRRGHKLAQRLEMDHFADKPQRPPYMRMTTYLRLASELSSVTREINRRVAARTARAKGPLSSLSFIVRWGL